MGKLKNLKFKNFIKNFQQTAKETSGGKVYLRFSKASAGEILIGPSLNTVTRTVGNAAVNMIQPGTCANNNLRCIQGYYCKSSGDTCTGVCHNSCLECTGTASTNCSQCSPMSDRGSLGPSGGSCGNGKDFLDIYLNFFILLI